MKIVSVHEGVVPISSSIRNAWIDFSSMDCSIVAVVSDIDRGRRAPRRVRLQLQRPVQGRRHSAPPDHPPPAGRPGAKLLERGRRQLDPTQGVGLHDAQREARRPRRALGRGRRHRHGAVRPGRQDRRAAAVPVPVRPYGDGEPDDSVFVYAAGGYYAPDKGLPELQDEMRRLPRPGLPRGQDEDRRRSPGRGPHADRGRARGRRRRRLRLAVDVNGRFDLRDRPASTAEAIEPYNLFWYEEVGDPLDYAPERRPSPSTTRAGSRPGRTCSPCRTPGT